MFKIAYFFTHFSTNFQDMVQLVEIDIEENEFIRNGMDAYMQIYENLKAAAEGNEQNFKFLLKKFLKEFLNGFIFILNKDILTLRDYQQTLNNGWVTIGDITPDSFNRRVAEYESALDKLEKKWSCQGQD